MKYVFSPVFPALRSKHGVGAEDVGIGGEETREDLFRVLFHREHLGGRRGKRGRKDKRKKERKKERTKERTKERNIC